MSIIQRELHNVRNGKKAFDEKAASLGSSCSTSTTSRRSTTSTATRPATPCSPRSPPAAGDDAPIGHGGALGGEEFMIITRQAGRADAFPLAERIRRGIEQSEFHVPPELVIHKTVSIGFCHYPSSAKAARS